MNKYILVPANSANVSLGPGDILGYISHLVVIPATTSPGAVTLIDGPRSITVFAGGANSVSNIVPFIIPLDMKSGSGAFNITTGANVSVIAVGHG